MVWNTGSQSLHVVCAAPQRVRARRGRDARARRPGVRGLFPEPGSESPSRWRSNGIRREAEPRTSQEMPVLRGMERLHGRHQGPDRLLARRTSLAACRGTRSWHSRLRARASRMRPCTWLPIRSRWSIPSSEARSTGKRRWPIAAICGRLASALPRRWIPRSAEWV